MILTESKLHRNLGLGLTGFIALWSALSEVVSAFQCGAFLLGEEIALVWYVAKVSWDI